ncbi:hypothetical protein [Photobacterium minamisatsumaniensis]|uniref:hypothetical protein n=1 Tax=Photobacterium minamisatsumaniensis TaxID=2910233 RepID=UPI003D1004FD
MNQNAINTLSLWTLFITLIFSAWSVNAAPTFQLDTLFQTSNENGHGVFTLSNTNRETIYVKGEVLQIQIEEGGINKIPLTRDNFMIWDLAVNPSKLRLLPGEVRDVAVKYLCSSNCNRSEDLVYQIRFSPVSAPEKIEGQEVAIAFGMAPYYVIPAAEQNVSYEWDYEEASQTVKVSNTGNTYLKVEFDNCNEFSARKSCRAVYHVLSGRYLEFKLPEGLQGSNVQVTVANHNQRYEDEFTL